MSTSGGTARPGAAQLTGALGTVALADVLQLLDLGRKTGVLAVDGREGRRGLIRLADGAITGARYEERGSPAHTTLDITGAVGALLALPGGRFAFTPADRPAAPGPRVRVEAVLMAALHAADERGRPVSPAPPPAVPADQSLPEARPTQRVPVLATSPIQSVPLRLRARHWGVLAVVDGRRDADAIAAACRVARAAADATLAELCAAGLVTFTDASGAVPRVPARSSVS